MAALHREWNEKINLVSRKDIEHLERHHYAPCIAAVKFLKLMVGARVIDVGTGALVEQGTSSLNLSPTTGNSSTYSGGTVLAGSPADFGKLIADETEKWGKVIRAANIKPE